jgi:Arc/MetJ family transcription regulator
LFGIIVGRDGCALGQEGESNSLRGLHTAAVATPGEHYRMRTNIVIDDALMEETRRATGLATKRETVDVALRTLLRLQQQETLRAFRGALPWQGESGPVDDAP